MFSICYKITSNYFDSQDLTQETFLSAYKNFSRFDGQNEKAWICRIATNKCLDLKKKASSSQIPTEDIFFEAIADQKNSTENICMEDFMKEQLLECCRRLKDPYREVATDYFYYELSTIDIAEKFGKSEKTVQTQVYRAKAMLQKLYRRE